MLEKILNLQGVKVLTKKETSKLIGGQCKACITIPGSGPMSDEQKAACKACQKENQFS